MSEAIPSVLPTPGEAAGRLTYEEKRIRILFVDDEPAFLDSLKHVMRRFRGVWRVDFASSGVEALAALADEPADVVISDMRMPGIDGAALLTEVRDSYPATIRIVLSGYGSPQDLTRAAIVAHRFLPKPFDVQELGLLVKRSCALRELTGQAEAYRLAVGATALPSRPKLFGELNQVLCDPRWGPIQVASVIERDVAMTAKVLQLANSAFFGVGHDVTCVRDAVVYLGIETIKSLTLTAEAFGKLAPEGIRGFSIDEFQHHAMLVAQITAGILPNGRGQQEAVTAALLHDIGELVLIAEGPRRWELLIDEAHRRQLPLHEIERELEGVTHAATGAYLLSLWGLPDCVVEAVAHHHDPGSVAGVGFDAVAAVHVADALAHELDPVAQWGPPPGRIDEALLDRLALRPRLDSWRELASRLHREP
jgi:HD-like signal output (HDOD) protein/ActR/RegA family two-component response regulator